MAAGLPPGGSYQPAPPLPPPVAPPAQPKPSDPPQGVTLDEVLGAKTPAGPLGPPVIVDREKLNLPTSLSSMEFIIKTIGEEPHKFLPNDIIKTSHQIKEIDQAPGKDHFQATVERKIRCKSADGKEQEFILQEKINIGIKVPEPRMSDQRTMTEAKMEALFAVDGYECRITRAICDRKISEVIKPVFKVHLQRATRTEGFYGDKSIRGIDYGNKPGISNAVKNAFTPHGSVKGSTVDGLKFTSRIFVPQNPFNPLGELSIIKRGKWTTFQKIPCPLEEKRSLSISSFTNPISTFLKESPRWKTALAANEVETKLLLNELKLKLGPKADIHLSDVMSTTTRSLRDQIDTLDDAIITDHTIMPPSTDEAILILSQLSKQLTQLPKDIAEIQTGVDTLQKVQNRNPKQEMQLQSLKDELASLNAQLTEIPEKAEEIKELLINRVQLHEYKMKVIQEKLDTVELLTTHCGDMVDPKNLEIHKQNLQNLHKQVEKAELHKRLTNLKKIIIKNTTLTEANLLSPIPLKSVKKPVPAAAPPGAAKGAHPPIPTKPLPPIPKKPLPPIPGAPIAPENPPPPIPEAPNPADVFPEIGPASLAAAAPVAEPEKDIADGSEDPIAKPPAIDGADAPFVGPADIP